MAGLNPQNTGLNPVSEMYDESYCDFEKRFDVSKVLKSLEKVLSVSARR